MKTNLIYRRHSIAKSPEFKLLKRLLVTFIACMCFIMLPEFSFGQSTSDWTLQKQEGDVKAYAKLDICTGETSQTFFVKFENTSTTQNYEIAYELSVPNNPTFPPIAGKIFVAAGNSAEGNCNQAPLYGLRMPIAHGTVSLNDLLIKYTLSNK
ncbi:MAG: hypothetical protein ACXWW0_05810 [Bacteroidia bacterium]